jgi:hypothetical protein
MIELLNRLRWLLAGALVNALIVAWTCQPLFEDPHLRPDDYRYLHLVQQLGDDGGTSLIEAFVVENRWDHLWWIDVEGQVRFFRPLVVLSYWLDSLVHGESDAIGLLLTNVLLHFGCTILVLLLLLRWLDNGLVALLASALFAAFFCHGETLWYVAGRTDTLGAIGFLGALAFHVYPGRLRPWLALPCFALALFSKELALGLPLVCLLSDRLLARPTSTWRQCLRDNHRLYIGYGLVAVAVLLIRGVALHGSVSSWPYPYFVLPSDPSFPGHIWTQLRSYGENLLLAQQTPPFIALEDLARWSTTVGLIVSVAALGIVAVLHRDRRLWFFLGLGLLVWAPTLFVYISERYLYLPSVAVAGIAGLALLRARRWPVLFVLSGLGLAVWCGHQAYWLRAKNDAVMNVKVHQTEIIEDQVRSLDLDLPDGGAVLLINAPLNWVGAQFVEDQLRVMFDDPELQVRVLTVMPLVGAMGGEMDLERGPDGASLTLRGRLLDNRRQRRHVILDRGRDRFPWVAMDSGNRFSPAHAGFDVRVLEGAGSVAASVRFELDSRLRRATILRWRPSHDSSLSPVERIEAARVEVLD